MQSPETAIAYVLGTFPTPSQTFIAREVRGLLAAGVPLHIFSLRRRARSALEPADREWFHRVRFAPLSISPAVLAANVYFLRRDPGRYASAVRLLLRLPHRPRVLVVRAAALLLVAAWIAREIERAGGCRHVHAHFALAQTEVAMAAGALLGCPFSFTAHARDIYATPSALPEKMRAARFVVTCTQYNLEYLRHLCPDLARERIQLVHHGVDATAYAQTDVDVHDDAPPLVLAAGRLIHKKGFDVLVAACGLLRDRGVTFRCRIVGDGPLRASLARAIRNASLDDVVELPGWLPADRLAVMLSRAAAFVAPEPHLGPRRSRRHPERRARGDGGQAASRGDRRVGDSRGCGQWCHGVARAGGGRRIARRRAAADPGRTSGESRDGRGRSTARADALRSDEQFPAAGGAFRLS